MVQQEKQDSPNFGKIDQNLAIKTAEAHGVHWHSADEPDFELDGFLRRTKNGPFCRFPEPSPVISEYVSHLAWHTAGGMLRFRSDTSEIRLDVKLSHISRMCHMTMIGSMGFDLYIGVGSQKQYSRSASFDFSHDNYLVTMFGPNASREMREFTLHFPLYSGVESFRIGLDSDAKIALPTQWSDTRPVVVYGTSVLQGGCASRPGMCYTNRLSRLLNRPFLNFGFSGNGKGEPEMARFLASIDNPSLYILDYDANAMGCDGRPSPDALAASLPEFLHILREAHPKTPILLVSKHLQAVELLDLGKGDLHEKYNRVHQDTIAKRQSEGDKNLYFLDGAILLGDEPSECTVDGNHPTDLGFFMMANHMAPVIRSILAQS